MLKVHLKRMLNEFINEIDQEKWFGKEREIVSRFSFTKLVKNVNCCEEFYDHGQIGIEVRVMQIQEEDKNKRQKTEVCKDMIIWKHPNQTVWSDENVPLCIMEWKHRNKQPSETDINWLKRYTLKYPNCFGIALNVENEKEYELTAVLIENGRIINRNWI